jgi:hypothetical protein
MSKIKKIVERYAQENPDLKKALLAEDSLNRGPVTRTEFWNILASIGWDRCPKYKEVKKTLVAGLNSLDAEDTYQHFHTLKSDLSEKLSSWEESTGEFLDLSETCRDALLSHVVGLGKEAYYKALSNPAEVAKRAAAGDFAESLTYAFPTADDYEI